MPVIFFSRLTNFLNIWLQIALTIFFSMALVHICDSMPAVLQFSKVGGRYEAMLDVIKVILLQLLKVFA